VHIYVKQLAYQQQPVSNDRFKRKKTEVTSPGVPLGAFATFCDFLVGDDYTKNQKF